MNLLLRQHRNVRDVRTAHRARDGQNALLARPNLAVDAWPERGCYRQDAGGDEAPRTGYCLLTVAEASLLAWV